MQRTASEDAVAAEGFNQAIEAERRIEPRSNVRAAWEALLEDARGCTRCKLYKYGTQTVFGLADGSECWVTAHPSFLLRIREPDRRRDERTRFVEDMKRIWGRAAKLAA